MIFRRIELQNGLDQIEAIIEYTCLGYKQNRDVKSNFHLVLSLLYACVEMIPTRAINYRPQIFDDGCFFLRIFI